ncbi:MAG TPA: cytochrome P450 [Ilumatobacteraceae bacterium]|nr:cytochrome P450 [Ilumatobacteraceae bacterium]
MTAYSHEAAATAFEPTELYGSLRDQCPVHHEADHDPPFYVLSRFDDILAVLKQPNQWINGDGPGVFYQPTGVLGTTDEPAHSRHRHVLRAAFLPTAIQRLAPRLRQIADELFDRMIPLGSGDFIELIAAPLPALAIAELLGVPDGDRRSFGALSDDAVAALTGGDVDRYHRAKAALEAHIDRGMAARQAMPVDERPADVLSILTAARADGTLSTVEALHIGYQLLVAGHETTTSLIGMMLYRLLEHPQVMARLRADPALIPVAVEEALRFDSPVHGLFRTNVSDCTLHDQQIQARSKLQLVYASANRDPRQFSDPDEFNIDRPPREIGRHIAFGWGIHHCIGAPLARLETAIAIELLLDRTTHIELAGDAERNRSFVLHGLTRLPIRWSTAVDQTAHDKETPADEH